MSNDAKKPGDDRDRQVVVSVRFPGHLLDRIQAMAAVMSTTANALIREGMEAYVQERASSEEFKAASQKYIAEAQARVATVLGAPLDGRPPRD
ncbi:hypothetical protein ACIF8T_22905 [Streptomyces sp. NPDC085946]|uniref:hypothetical protein n=1 Tax=Streptomyces sp. NPDC085946 TaxID=3365744 RepID=UPI0037D979DE